MTNVLRTLAEYRHLHGTIGAIRVASFEGERRLVVPVVALRSECVIQPMGAVEPEFVSAACLSKAPQGWNGRPVVLGHPERNGRPISANTPDVLERHAFGTVFSSRLDGDRLRMEAWLDPARAERVGAATVLKRLQAGETVEVSVGAFVITEPTTGTHGGKTYRTVWRDVVPDHIAFLPDGAGACSVEMGCGARAASAWAEYEPPNGYTIALEALQEGRTEPDYTERLEQMQAFRDAVYMNAYASMLAASEPATDDVYLNPPNPYDEALKR